jgi:HEAT repeat protein
VRAAAIFALRKCNRPVDPTPLASMVVSDDPEVRGNAAIVLGELGNRSAVPLLQNALGHGLALANPSRVRIVELQIAEAQVKLGDKRAVEPIRAALYAPPEQAEIVILACQICGRLRDQPSAGCLRGLLDATGQDMRPPEIRLAAITGLAVMGGGEESMGREIEAAAMNQRADLRAQAAVAMAALKDRNLLPVAEVLLSDTNPMVQIAAAKAVAVLTE